MHWSVREKMDQISKTDPAGISPALKGFEYEEGSKLWAYHKRTTGQRETMPEFPIPGDGTLQNWLCGDWLKSQH
jgi:hypothetical protein